MTGLFDADDNATPLTPEERNGLIPTHVSLRSELNEIEQKNIAAADSWAFSRKRNVTDEVFLRNLHRRMFENVWRWAGEYRTTERNLGVAPYRIQPDLVQAIGDAQYWIIHKAYATDELAVRFHHKLVSIHPFPNGNGRWSRLAGDLMAIQLGAKRFSWGSVNLRAGNVRQTYIDALHAADAHDFTPLINFARS